MNDTYYSRLLAKQLFYFLSNPVLLYMLINQLTTDTDENYLITYGVCDDMDCIGICSGIGEYDYYYNDCDIDGIGAQGNGWYCSMELKDGSGVVNSALSFVCGSCEDENGLSLDYLDQASLYQYRLQDYQ